MTKGKRITKPAQLPEGMPQMTVQEFEDWVVLHATHFSIFYLKAGKRYHHETKTLNEAIAYRADHPKKMIYAVTEAGRSAMLAPCDYYRYLKLRNEVTI